MIDVGNFEQTQTLKNGVTVRIRAIRPADKAAIVDAFGKLDPESVYTRFFRAKDSLEDQELKAATEVDFENAVAAGVDDRVRGEEDPLLAAAPAVEAYWSGAAQRWGLLREARS